MYFETLEHFGEIARAKAATGSPRSPWRREKRPAPWPQRPTARRRDDRPGRDHSANT
jgi:hypothetical protein